jgi:hypothetical protein
LDYNLNDIPQWLDDVRASLPEWIEQVRHPGPFGMFRFAVDAYEPFDLDSSQIMSHTLPVLGIEPSDTQRREWIDYLISHQRASDGLFIDERMERHAISKGPEPSPEELTNVRRFITRNCAMTLLRWGELPLYPLRHDDVFSTSREMIDYLDNLHWHNPWGAGSWAGAAIWFQHVNRQLGADDGAGDDIIRAGVEWLEQHQDPETGTWSDGSEIAPHVLINGIFKVWMNLLGATDFKVQYPDRVVDLCIDGLQSDPVLQGTPDACSIFDVALVLDVALRFTDHRRSEVADIMQRCVDSFRMMARSDGAFSYGPDGSLQNHGGLALAPHRLQSDASGTSINVNGLALVCNLCGLRTPLGWVPVSEWLLGLT